MLGLPQQTQDYYGREMKKDLSFYQLTVGFDKIKGTMFKYVHQTVPEYKVTAFGRGRGGGEFP